MKRKPTAWLYTLCFLLPLAGIIVGLVLGIPRTMASVDAWPRLVAPGELTFDLEPGTRTGYYESRTVVNGTAHLGGPLEGLRCELVGPDGANVPLTTSSTSSSYQLGSREGASVFAAKVVRRGAHRLACAYEDGREGPTAVIALGESIMGSVLAMLAPMMLGFLAGIVVWIVVASRRRAFDRAAKS